MDTPGIPEPRSDAKTASTVPIPGMSETCGNLPAGFRHRKYRGRPKASQMLKSAIAIAEPASSSASRGAELARTSLAIEARIKATGADASATPTHLRTIVMQCFPEQTRWRRRVVAYLKAARHERQQLAGSVSSARYPVADFHTGGPWSSNVRYRRRRRISVVGQKRSIASDCFGATSRIAIDNGMRLKNDRLCPSTFQSRRRSPFISNESWRDRHEEARILVDH